MADNRKHTRVVNIRKEAYDVYIGRAGKGQDGYFGNPFRLKQDMDRGGTLAGFREYFYRRLVNDAEYRRRVHELQGKTLGCFCKPHPCHGDIIKELHIPADTRSAFPVISVHSPVSIQYRWQS